MKLLTDAGFNVVSLANNHVFDFGETGFASTKSTLNSVGLQYSSKRGEVAEFNIRGTRVALIAADFYGGRRSISNPNSTYAEIRRLKKEFDVVIVSAHAGAEGYSAVNMKDEDEVFLGENRGNTFKFAHNAVLAGADLIIMHGPHVPRAMEVFHNRLIMYSLGNFTTSQGISINGLAGIAPVAQVQIRTDGQFLQGYLHSFKQTKNYGAVYDRKAQALKLISNLSEENFGSSAPVFEQNGHFTPRVEINSGSIEIEHRLP